MVTALLVTSAATLLESAPFILAAVLLAQTPLRWNARFDAYLGCGCGVGPSARSLPAAAATWLVFGPLVAGARLAAALLVERFQHRHSCPRNQTSLLAELQLIAPVAGLGAACTLLLPAIAATQIPGIFAFVLGAGGAFAIAPCALGGVGLAAMLRTVAPPAAAGFLSVAGIVDLRAWMHSRPVRDLHDPLAYALVSLACGVVAARAGGELVHPKIALALWPCALAAAAFAFRYRNHACAKLRIAPALMLAGAFLAAPLPQYHATETTLGDAYAGERVDFTGVLTRTGNAATLVRYAITCCRADAAPIVVRLSDAPPSNVHGWLHAGGVLIARGSALQLRVDTLRAIDAPADPFVYR